MSSFKVCVVGGYCSNRIMIVAEQLTEFFENQGIDCQVITHGCAGEGSFPPRSNLILQLLPAFTEEEAGVPVINIKPLIGDPAHPATIEKILKQVQAYYAVSSASMCLRNPIGASMSSRIYLDYCATTPVHPSVRDEMLRVFDADYGNPSSMHWAGKDSRQLIDRSRADVASGLGCQPSEIVFTSGATEADNLALFGTLRLFPSTEAHLITSAIEHHAVLHAAHRLEQNGYSVTYLPVDEHGLVNPEDVRRAIRPETKLISIMYVNNEVGSVQSIAEIGKIAREHSVRFHTDAVQAIGLFDVSVDKLNVDLLSLSAHKIYGPKGIGALYVRAGLQVVPMILGGPQENSLRAGTENVPGIVGLGAAMNHVRQHRAEERIRIMELRKSLINGLQALGAEVIVNGSEDATAPHILSISFVGVDAEMMLIRLNSEGIAVSLGSACNSKSIELSHVLTAMKLPQEQIESTLRFSLGMPTTKDEIERLLDLIRRVLPRVIVQ